MNNSQEQALRYFNLHNHEAVRLYHGWKEAKKRGARRGPKFAQMRTMRRRVIAASMFHAGAGWSTIRALLPGFTAADQLTIEKC